MNDTRPTGTRHIPGTPLDDHAAVEPKHTHKRRKPTSNRFNDYFPDVLLAVNAIVGLAVAFDAVAPHLANNTHPDPADWTILIVVLATLGFLGYAANHKHR